MSATEVSPGSVVAGIDCGTNSIRLLISEWDGITCTDRVRRMETNRLGQGLEQTGRMAPEALERTFAACSSYADDLKKHDAAAVRFVATSASRDADNADEFRAGVREILGIEPEVISGHEEASLSYLGATRSLDLRYPALLFDIGGGSTEFVRGERAPIASFSTRMGCVRFTERFSVGGKATPGVLPELTAAVATNLVVADQHVGIRDAASLVGVAGTVTTVAALALGLTHYDPERIHGSELRVEQVLDTVTMLQQSTDAERRQMPVMHPGRVDVIVAGATILAEIMRFTEASVLTVSEHDILDGIVWSVLGVS